MRRFREKEVKIPKTKSYERGNLFLALMRTELCGMKLVLHIASFQERYSLLLELLKLLSRSAEYSMFQLIVCIKEASNTMRGCLGGFSNVTIVDEDSLEYASHLATAAYVFSDDSLPWYYVRRKEQQLVFFPREQSDLSISQLLNATILVSLGEYYTKLVYKEQYGLDGIFRGIILQPIEKSGAKEYAKGLLDYIVLKERKQDISCSYFSQRKRRMLFVMDVNKEDDLWNKIALIQQIDYEEYDVTVLFASSIEGWRERLKSLLPLAHLIEKQGRVNYSDDGYIGLERMRYLFSHTENITSVFDKRPEKELITEWHRLLGDTTYEYAYLLSPYTVFWYAMFLEVASQKIGIFPGKKSMICLNNRKKDRMYDINTIQVINQFDKAVLLGKAMKENYEAVGEINPAILVSVDLEYGLFSGNKEILFAERENKRYYELMIRSETEGVYSAVYLQAKREQEMAAGLFLLSKEVGVAEKVLKRIYRIANQIEGIVFYIGVEGILEKEETIAVDEQYRERIYLYPIELATMELFTRMDLFLEMEEEPHAKLEYLSAKLGRPLFSLGEKEEQAGVAAYVREKEGMEHHIIKDVMKEYEKRQKAEIDKIQQ